MKTQQEINAIQYRSFYLPKSKSEALPSITDDLYSYLGTQAYEALDGVDVSRDMVKRNIDIDIIVNFEIVRGSLEFSGLIFEGSSSHDIMIMLLHANLDLVDEDGNSVVANFNQNEFNVYINS